MMLSSSAFHPIRPIFLYCKCARTGQRVETFNLPSYANPIACIICPYCNSQCEIVCPSPEVRSYYNA